MKGTDLHLHWPFPKRHARAGGHPSPVGSVGESKPLPSSPRKRGSSAARLRGYDAVSALCARYRSQLDPRFRGDDDCSCEREDAHRAKKGFATALLLLLFLLPLPALAAVKVEAVTSAGGIKAWLVRDDKLPLIALHFAFRGGVEQDPADKQGLAELTAALLGEGAGDYDSEAFQQRLADKSIQLGVSAGRDALHGSLKTLREFRETAFAMLRLSLTQPRFDAEALERVRGQQLAQMRQEIGDPDWQARRALFDKLFAGHPYAMRHFGTTRSLASLTREDAKDFAARHLARDNLVVGVAGAITPEELGVALDQIFGALPEHAKQTPVGEAVWPEKSATILVAREGTQSQLLFALPAPKRDDADWYAAEIVNYIIGGGGFSSRLMQDVRDKAGLTYGIGTGLAPMDHAAILVGQAATENAKAGEAWAIIRETWRKFYESGVTEAEVDAAKDYLTGSVPLHLTSTGAIAGTLVGMQLDGLGPDYLDAHDALVRGVTLDAIHRVLRRWFDPEKFVTAIVGEPAGINPTERRETVRE